MAKFFCSSQPINKQEFVETFKEIVFISQLLTAPFGLSDELLLNIDETLIHDEYSLIYKEWEETLARRIYAKTLISDDRVAATLHKYLEIDHDIEVGTNLR